MTRDRFHNRLRILTSIDLHELQEVGPGPFDEPAEWAAFRDDPFRYFVRCNDETCDRIWQVVLKRDAGSAAREVAVIPDDATEIVDKIRSQNWKFGGVLTMDVDQAVALVQAVIDTAKDTGANAAAVLAEHGMRDYRRTVLAQLVQLHAELGAKRDHIMASSPNDRVGQAHAAAIMQGVGKAIGIVQSTKTEA